MLNEIAETVEAIEMLKDLIIEKEVEMTNEQKNEERPNEFRDWTDRIRKERNIDREEEEKSQEESFQQELQHQKGYLEGKLCHAEQNFIENPMMRKEKSLLDL